MMPEYRAYAVGNDGHFKGFEEFVCADDGAATEKAKSLVNGRDVELWSGARFVIILKHRDHLSAEVHALNRQIDQSELMSKDAKGDAAIARMNKLTTDLTRERDAQQKRDDED